MAISLTKAGRSEAARVNAVLRALAAFDGATYAGTTQALERALADGLVRAILATTEGRDVGGIVFYPDFSTLRGQPGVYVQDLFVDAGARGQGLGRGLLAAAMVDAREGWGAEYMILYADPENALAQGFYAAMGFKARKYQVLLAEAASIEGQGG